MRYTLYVNQSQALEYGLNINQALILQLIGECHSWASPEIIDNEVYYWTARQMIADELKILDLKPDTVYRHLKVLAEKGLIEYKKSNKKDCVKLTQKGKSYYVGNKSEKVENSEMNPTKLGNKSENNSEINPTYHNTNFNQITKDKDTPKPSLNIINHQIYISFDDKEKELFNEYWQFRKSKKLPTTEKVANRLLESYVEFGRNYQIIEKAIMSGWKDFYPISNNTSKKQSNILEDLGI